MDEMQVFDRMKARWGVGLWGAVAILLAFSLAGMTVVRIKGPIMGALLPDHHASWLTWAVYIVVVFPVYQLLLLGYGSALGQFGFFWGKIRKTWRFLLGWMLPRSG